MQTRRLAEVGRIVQITRKQTRRSKRLSSAECGVIHAMYTQVQTEKFRIRMTLKFGF